jgi:hypothetical protein
MTRSRWQGASRDDQAAIGGAYRRREDAEESHAIYGAPGYRSEVLEARVVAVRHVLIGSR